MSAQKSVGQQRLVARTRRDFLTAATVGTAAGLVWGAEASAQERKAANVAEKASREAVDEILQEWKAKPREVARTMIEKYGQPDGATATHLVWHENGPWKQTTVYNLEIPHNFPKKHVDMLEQTISYRVPPEKFDELAAYDGSVTVRRTIGEMSAMCDKEAMNFLALNLAHDLITGKLDVEQARQAYAEAAIAFTKGEKPESTQGLQFRVAARGGTGDPDEAIIGEAQQEQKER